MTHCVSNPDHSDRLAARLPMAPHPTRGDLDEVLRLRRVIAQLAPFFARAVEESVEFVHELEESGVDPSEPCLAGLKTQLARLRDVFVRRDDPSTWSNVDGGEGDD